MDEDGEELEKAWAAYNRQDYLTARLIWEALAYRRNVIAQYNLGFMYRKGLGVPEDYVLAARWYRQAEGKADSQTNPGDDQDVLSSAWTELSPLPPPSADVIQQRLDFLKTPAEKAENTVTMWEGRWRNGKPHPTGELLIRSAALWWKRLFETGNATIDPNEASANNIQMALKRLGIPPDRWWESVRNMEQGGRKEGREDVLKAIAAWRLRQQLS
jgi:hypothetical protein